MLNLRLKDQFKQECLSFIENSSKTICYRIFKTDLNFEQYFSILPYNLLFTFCKFRCGSHRLPIETGRWHGSSRSERICHLCEASDIGDEYHYIMCCDALNDERKKFLPYYCCFNPNTYKFNQLLNCTNKAVLEKLCRFIKIITVKVSPPG